MASWKIFEGTGTPRDPAPELPAAPPWRTFPGIVAEDDHAAMQQDKEADRRLGGTAVAFDPRDDVVMMVNAALHLRRALLVTGKPGVGKSSLPYLVARELRLGPVLRWPIVSRSTLQSGLYSYDALARLQAAQAIKSRRVPRPEEADGSDGYMEIGRFVQLGPLGTALLPRRRPRVLLIDEIDKCDIDLPDDLLTVLEEGSFRIPELERYEKSDRVRVRTDDRLSTAVVEKGQVTCHEFPLVIMTSNGERDFPPAFLRRCLRVTMAIEPEAEPKRLRDLVEAHLGTAPDARVVDQLLNAFTMDTEGASDEAIAKRAPDQLMNAVFIIARNAMPDQEAQDLADRLFRPLES